tara:strand:+ start:163 stop:534 length:372 start_codon:yes stop_codon:yes gene_type:complete
MTYKKHKSLLSKHIIQEILPIFEDFFSSLDEKFDELTKEELTEIYLRDILNYVNNFDQSPKKSRRINPYASFLSDKEFQTKLRNENPDLTFGELSKLKGKIWKSFSEEKKESYRILAEKNSST